MTEKVEVSTRSNGTMKNTWEAPNGLKVQLMHVSQFLLLAAGKKVKIPNVPTTFNEDKGREEENPLDPDYIVALQEAQADRGLAILGAMLSMGVKILKEPSDLLPLASEEWPLLVEEVTGEKVPNNASIRRLMWMKYVALNDETTFNELLKAITRFNRLVREGDVTDAEDAFRGQAGRDST